jgi:hypothetical protein
MDRLDEIEQELNDATERTRRLVSSTEGRLFTVRPHPSAWSASECVAHLSMTTETFLPMLKSVIEDARKRGVTAKARPSLDLMGRFMKWFLEPPVRKRVATTAPFVPRAVRARAEALAEFIAQQGRLIDVLHSARGLPLNRMKVVSPFNPRVKYNVYSAFRILAAHERRHLWQAERAVEVLRGRLVA